MVDNVCDYQKKKRQVRLNARKQRNGYESMGINGSKQADEEWMDAPIRLTAVYVRGNCKWKFEV